MKKELNLYSIVNRVDKFYVVASSFDEAAKVLEERLNEAEYGYTNDRESESITLLAKEHFFPGHKQLFFDSISNLVVINKEEE